jgi:hypothetical protein
VVTTAVRQLVRPATRWRRVGSMASASVIAGRMVVSRARQRRRAHPDGGEQEKIMVSTPALRLA